MKKLLTVLMSLVLMMTSMTFIACGPLGGGSGDDDKNKTVLNATLAHGGLGKDWFDEAARAYEELHKDDEFEPGKKGVKIYSEQHGASYSLTSTDGNDFVVLNPTNQQQYIRQGLLYDLSDLYTKPSKYDGVAIKDKVNMDATYGGKGEDGSYYTVPLYETSTGISYNRNIFNEHGLFFTDDEENGVLVETVHGNAYFVTDNEEVEEGNFPCELSKGPDHKAGTSDDGLPSTLQEFFILCAQMVNCGVTPMIFSGTHHIYANNIVSALWASLSGYDQIKTFYTYDGGPVKVVGTNLGENPGAVLDEVKYTLDSLIPDSESKITAKKPETQWIDKIEIDGLSNGHYIDDMAAKYYAIATLEMMEQRGYYSKLTTATHSHTDAQLSLLSGGFNNNEKIGMLAESSYWWNEAEKDNMLSDFETISQMKASDLDVRFMPLPTALDEEDIQDREAKYRELGKEYDWTRTMVSSSVAQLFVPKQVSNDPDRLNVVLDFIDFLTSEAQLRNISKSLGLPMAYKNYTEPNENICQDKSVFSRELINTYNESKIVYSCADSKIFRQKFDARTMTVYADIYSFAGTTSIIEQMREKKKTSAEIFNGLRITKNQWDSFKA